MAVFDYAWSVPTVEQLQANGSIGVMRYASRDPSKNLSAAERDRLLAAGQDIGLVWESAAGDALNGAGQGAFDGAAMRAFMDQMGCPASMAAYWAVDQNVSESDWPALDAYGNAFKAQMGGRPTGVYAESDYIDHALAAGVVSYGWFPGATSWSSGRITPQAHLIQRVGSPIAGTDLNDTQRMPFGSWLTADLGGFLMALSDEQQTQLFNKVMGNGVFFAIQSDPSPGQDGDGKVYVLTPQGFAYVDGEIHQNVLVPLGLYLPGSPHPMNARATDLMLDEFGRADHFGEALQAAIDTKAAVAALSVPAALVSDAGLQAQLDAANKQIAELQAANQQAKQAIAVALSAIGGSK